jgi:S-adenosylmethionine hydrolase
METKKGICGLITDFGNTDYFIGTLKGVIKKINPHVEVIDISNDIPSYSLLPASFALEKTYRFFPAGSLFLVVVDPGVGTRRKILLVEYDDYFFIAPDNGVLTPILQKEKKAVSVIDNKNYFLIDGISTFEARDKMAPAAAYLLRGVDPREMALPVNEYIIDAGYSPTLSVSADGNDIIIEAIIAYIDKFGNLMTNVSADFLFESLETSGRETFKALLNSHVIEQFYDTYGQAGTGPFMLIGSHRNLEIAVNQASAAAALNAQVGDKVAITFHDASGGQGLF